MLKKIKDNPAAVFVAKFLAIFVVLYYFFLFYEGITAPGNFYSPFLHEHLDFVQWFRNFLLKTSAGVLELFGYQTFRSTYILQVADHAGIRLVYSCLGFGVMSFFTAFVIAYPVSWKRKLFFLIGGLIGIQVLNITRFCVLALVWKPSGSISEIDHHMVFNIIIYIAIFVALHLWVKSNRSVLDERNTTEKSLR